MSNNLNSGPGEASFHSVNSNDDDINGGTYQTEPQPVNKKRTQTGHPDPSADVIALSPRTLLATNRFVCEICNKGFQRDQNLQLHRRGHNLPWKLKKATSNERRKKVFVCPESSCVHHDPSRALGDLTGIKKHFCRKHCEKKWKCDKCLKKYAVQSDWKAHSKTCGTKEHRCDCGSLFSRRDSFMAHRTYCNTLAEERARSIARNSTILLQEAAAIAAAAAAAAAAAGSSSAITHQRNLQQIQSQFSNTHPDLPFPIIKKEQQQNVILRPKIPPWRPSVPIIGPGLGPTSTGHLTSSSSLFKHFSQNHDHNQNPNPSRLRPTTLSPHYPSPPVASPHISATGLLQKAAQMGAKYGTQFPSPAAAGGMFIRPPQGLVSAGNSGHIATPGFGLKLSSSNEFIHVLASSGNKTAAVTGDGTIAGACASAGGHSNVPTIPPPSLLIIHDMVMKNPHPFPSSTGFQGSAIFEDVAFGGDCKHSSKKDHENFHATVAQFSSGSADGNEAGGDDNMTRDFLGLNLVSGSKSGLGDCETTN